MRGMNSESVDLIYLDPPFNSNKNYAAPIGSEAAGAAFKDTWTLDDVDLAWHGEIAEQEPALYSIIDAAGLAHGKPMKAYLIMMAVRLLEMRRLLKPSGSIYLHCDPTASHYLKMTMDTVFGVQQYQNEISWRRSNAHNDSKKFASITDSILYYRGRDAGFRADSVRVPLRDEYVKKAFRYTDERGRYRTNNMVASSLSGGGYTYEFHGHNGPWIYPESRMRALETDGRIHLPKKAGGVPSRRYYLHENKGQVPSNQWTDIAPPTKKEKTGYPTQKPLALLQRIIVASSDEGDVVLDPFCGCATACVAAQSLGRQWVGIDISPKAAELVRLRLKRDLGLFYKGAHRTDIPKRTDLGDVPKYNIDANKRYLFGKQEGLCNGCKTLFPYRNLTIDHIVPRSKGGTDHIDNLQLLCGACNSTKGAGTQEELIVKLKRDGIRVQ